MQSQLERGEVQTHTLPVGLLLAILQPMSGTVELENGCSGWYMINATWNVRWFLFEHVLGNSFHALMFSHYPFYEELVWLLLATSPSEFH